jgi:hypothetical protein
MTWFITVLSAHPILSKSRADVTMLERELTTLSSPMDSILLANCPPKRLPVLLFLLIKLMMFYYYLF